MPLKKPNPITEVMGPDVLVMRLRAMEPSMPMPRTFIQPNARMTHGSRPRVGEGPAPRWLLKLGLMQYGGTLSCTAPEPQFD